MTAFQTFTAGQILTAAQVTALQANSTKVAIFQDQKASGTSGGNATTGSFLKRTLNTTVVNNITACSISSDVITLTAGSYLVTANAPFYRVDNLQIRLQNTTAGTTLILGGSMLSPGTGEETTQGSLIGYITLTGSTNIELQYRVATNTNSNSLGVATGWGTEVYSTIVIQQVA
jgi:hypothetical protein